MLLERIKRQNAGEEDLPPIAMPPLRKSQAPETPRSAKPSREEELTEDGFLDLDNGDEGFLLEEDAELEEDDSTFDAELEDDDFQAGAGGTDVIDEFLGGMAAVALSVACSLSVTTTRDMRQCKTSHRKA